MARLDTEPERLCSPLYKQRGLGALVIAGAVLAVACNGAIIDRTSSDNQESGGSFEGMTPEQVLASAQCKKHSPGRAPLRRLSNAEYRNAALDLFAGIPGAEQAIAQATRAFPSEPESLGFRNNADLLSVPALVAQKYMDFAETMAPLAASAPSLLPCTNRDAACARQFIERFGKRVYRRPLGSEEVARYERIYESGATDGFQAGIEWVVFALLQSPQFVYRVEYGEPGSSPTHRPTAYEMASRLSFLLWQSVPDDELLRAAEAGELERPEQIAERARAMLKDERASRVFEYFSQWLDLDKLDAFSRDAQVYSGIPQRLPELFVEETRLFVADLLARPDGDFVQLLSAPYTFANAELARHYGLADGPTGSSFEKVVAPERAGILTQGMLVAHDKPTRSSIVHRGLKIRIDLLCQNVPAPPDDVDLDLDSQGGQLTQRERLEAHRTEAACAGCHELMDPIGVTFENFDAVGRLRSVDENGAAVNTSSVLTNTDDADGPLNGAVELAHRLAHSEQARACYVKQSFRFFYGREVDDADACSMARLLVDFKGSAHNLSELLVSLTQTDAFLYRASSEEPTP